ncbi:HlyD family type I secretion periplasmic adaptor subunit [uncultured Alsobacter sp.]|uniref:HlyD family type I secretion periplasmic adaptor subunit n=1 Tax=uncultured Alsobacter sp. TaxID=1748258 RepID=UPI0025E59450|nr:HlyD family type I secretion periplasmic adaptor subunit [uncultured Alsobacter sp.]
MREALNARLTAFRGLAVAPAAAAAGSAAAKPPAVKPAAKPASAPPVASTDWIAPLRVAGIVVLVVFALGGGWSMLARLDAATVAPGVVSVESNRKAIQHLEGGIVREILARDGDKVQAGAVLVRLDPTQARANAEVVRKQYAAALAEEARLIAERDGKPAVAFPPEVTEKLDDPLVARAVADQVAQFRDRRASLNGQVSILQARISQQQSEIAALERERESSQQQIATVKKELVGLRQLLEKNLVSVSRVLSLEREQSRLEGLLGRTEANVMKSLQTIDEARLQIEQAKAQFNEQVGRDLPAVRKSVGELRERVVATSDILSRLDIRAPQAGVVQGSKIFTAGGVIRPGDTLMEVVPLSDELVIRAQVGPMDVDKVRRGMEAEVRFQSFTVEHPPIFVGKVRTISPDRLVDDQTRQPYFSAEIALDRDQIPAEFRQRIGAGMQADVLIATGERTALRYLVAPLLDRLATAMRER